MRQDDKDLLLSDLPCSVRHNYARESEHTLNVEKELSQRKQSTSRTWGRVRTYLLLKQIEANIFDTHQKTPIKICCKNRIQILAASQ